MFLVAAPLILHAGSLGVVVVHVIAENVVARLRVALVSNNFYRGRWVYLEQEVVYRDWGLCLVVVVLAAAAYETYLIQFLCLFFFVDIKVVLIY